MPIRKRDLLRRIEALEARLAQPTPQPLEGQQTIPVATIGHHAYEGPGACQAEDFGKMCGKHRDEHQILEETP
ncbi:hypothetical protein ACFZAR_36230 [Streptomyces sp. NPDC008222]|uniref:hypothetical protein n=1 Tax=Streptomyces sp. NPDC008222 TaxID=3364820 RepID=UPI0036E34352